MPDRSRARGPAWPTVAIVGPDGAGKTTIAHRLPGLLRMPVHYIYMGLNYDASNYLLPTNRLVRWLRNRDVGTLARIAPTTRRVAGLPVLKQARAAFKLANLLMEGWYRQLLANHFRRRGELVIFDRHFLADYPADPISGRAPLRRRIRHMLLARALPRPDLVIYLDAPAEVLRGRKSEESLETLAEYRREYQHLVNRLPGAIVVDASRDADLVGRDVAAAIRRYAERSTVRGLS